MISANLGHAAQVLSGPDDRAFCSHFGVSDAFDASALVAAGLPAASADAFWPTLGYACGNLAQTRVPALTGIAHLRPTRDELKAFAAAFGTSGAAALFQRAHEMAQPPLPAAPLSPLAAPCRPLPAPAAPCRSQSPPAAPRRPLTAHRSADHRSPIRGRRQGRSR